MKKIRGAKISRIIIHTYIEISQGNSLCTCLYLKLKCHVFVLYFLFSPTKLEKRIVEQVLPREEGWHQLEGVGFRERG
jgi:hypothetical protein